MLPGSNGLPNPNNRAGFVTPAAGPVDLEIGPGGDLFYAGFDDGTIRRIQYFGLNQPPIASATATPTSGDAPLAVAFDGSGSSDPDPSDTISYSWDLNGDGVYGDSTAVAPTFTYATPGTYTVRLRVTDNHGASSTSQPITISAGNTPPEPVIDSPASTLTWKVGDTISFSGHATDSQEGNEPASRLSWALILHHCPSNCHTHPVQTFNGVAGGSFSTPDHEYPSYLELQLTATDSQGLTGSRSVELDPHTVNLSFPVEPGRHAGHCRHLHRSHAVREDRNHQLHELGKRPEPVARRHVLRLFLVVGRGRSDAYDQRPEHPDELRGHLRSGTFSELAAGGRRHSEPDKRPDPAHGPLRRSESSDPDGDLLSRSWDLNGDGTFGDSSAVAPTFTFTKPGRVTVRLRVSDNHGASSTASVSIQSRRRPGLRAAFPLVGPERQRYLRRLKRRGAHVHVREARSSHRQAARHRQSRRLLDRGRLDSAAARK